MDASGALARAYATVVREAPASGVRLILVAHAALAVFFVLLAVLGGVLNYSPVPFWDMWGSYFGFLTRLQAGDESVWWAQHNEHRIVISRFLFWLNSVFFPTSLAPLVIANFVLVGSIFVLMAAVLRSLLRDSDKKLYFCSAMVICALTFSWMQSHNFTDPFQNPLFTAQLLPLAAFFMLALSSTGQGSSYILFGAASLAGFASAGTMANGVLILPLMALMSIGLRRGWPAVAWFALLSAVTLYLYFSDYYNVAAHSSPFHTLKHEPIALAKYILVYLGGPFYVMTGRGVDLFFTQVMGALFIGLAALILGIVVFSRDPILELNRERAIRLALLAVIVYVILTAVLAGSGRINLGLPQALSGRYMTSSLMAWSALLMLGASLLRDRLGRPEPVLAGLILIPILLLPSQLQARKVDKNMYFERMVAALSLEMAIVDAAQIQKIYPNIEHATARAEPARAQNWSIFGHSLLKDVAERMGAPVPPPARACLGYIDALTPVPQDARYVRVAGWLFEPAGQSTPRAISIVDANGRMVGYALTGLERPDVAKVVNPKGRRSGFRGYVLTEYQDQPLILHGEKPDCGVGALAPRK